MVLRHEHQPADLDLEGMGVVFRDVPLDQIERFLDGLLAILRGLVDSHLRVVNLADQLAHGLAGDAPEHVENGELDGGQGHAESHAAQPEVEAVDIDLLQQQVQVARVLADEERLHLVDEDGLERIQLAVPDRNSLGPVPGTHPAQEIALVPKQLQRLDDDRRREQLLLENGLPEDLIEHGVPGVHSSSPIGLRRHGGRHPAGKGTRKELSSIASHRHSILIKERSPKNIRVTREALYDRANEDSRTPALDSLLL